MGGAVLSLLVLGVVILIVVLLVAQMFLPFPEGDD